MRYLTLFLLTLLVSLNSVAQTKVLISYFEGFDGAPSNHTQDVAKKLNEIEILKSKGIEVVLCPIVGAGIPVVYHSNLETNKTSHQKTAFKAVKKCLDENPDITNVYSLGESFCDTLIETTAYNAMKANVFDNEDNIFLDNEKIIDDSIIEIGIDRERNIKAFCFAALSNQEFGSLNRLSHSPGTFVCNNLSFNMSAMIKKERPEIKYNFIHVPINYDRAEYHQCSSFSETYGRMLKKIDTKSNKKEAFTDLIVNNISEFVMSKISLQSQSERGDNENQISCNPGQERVEQINTLENNVNSVIAKSSELQQCIEYQKKKY